MSNINNNMQTQTSNTLHNAIMEAGSKDRPLMLAPGNYIKWKLRIKRYIDTKPNRELIHYFLENPPYELGWNDKPVLDSEGNPTTAIARVFETYKNVTQEIRDQLNVEAEAVKIILTRIDNDIYSTVDACPLNGPINCGLNFPRFPKRITPLHGDTFNMTLSPISNSVNLLLRSV
nr:hypothetical protein [Tanacetum cinerariifolium]